jgi:hypothetical protein
MDQRRRHLHVADLTCLHCAEKDAELERKADIIEALQRELNKSMENEAGALAAAKAAGNALNAAKAQITREQKRSVKAGQVQQVVDHWRLLRPRTGPEFGEPGSKSFAVIEKALVLMASDPAGAVTACCEAIDGLHMAPWDVVRQALRDEGEGPHVEARPRARPWATSRRSRSAVPTCGGCALVGLSGRGRSTRRCRRPSRCCGRR